MTRREFVLAAASAPLVPGDDGLFAYLASLARPDGAYGWAPDPSSHLTPTFAVIACHRLLGRPVPRKTAVAGFIREHYPMMPARHKNRPLRRFDYEQIQGTLWLGEDASGWTEEVRGWTGPSVYTKAYEHEGHPVFQHEVMALLCRKLLGIPAATPAWKTYVLSRRRANGSFNNTPAEAAGDGHIMNTWWGLQACEALGEAAARPALFEWLAACQLPNGAFTWQPKAELAPVDDVAYTWAALRCFEALGKKPPRSCSRWLHSLRNADGGYGDRPGRQSNPTATMYALDALRVIGERPRPARNKAAVVHALPAGLKVFTAQIEAPGAGSPAEAVELARVLRIHLWGAKNAEPGWVARCQEVADARKVAVRFFVANEEYGCYVKLPGLGTPSHLADMMAPAGADAGRPLNDRERPTPWPVFRDQRIGALRRARGAMVWQFNENEELTRVLLDEAVARGTYAAVSSFHFGNENFLNTQPFLMRYYGLLPFVGLQDAHTRESWWWGDQLAGFRTVFLARDASWEAWLEALRENRVMAIRHDAISNWEMRLAGGSKEVRRRVLAAENAWRWWGTRPDQVLRPAASLMAIRPGEPFEAGAPETGVAVRLRCRHENTTMGGPKTPLVELVSLSVDGVAVTPELVELKNNRGQPADRYHIHRVAAPGGHRAEARVRTILTGEESALAIRF